MEVGDFTLTQESILAKSSKREWEKTGGKSVFSFLDVVPTLIALLALLNLCFHVSQNSVSNVRALRLIPMDVSNQQGYC